MKRVNAIIELIFVVGISLLFFSSYVGELRAASPTTGKTPEKHHPDLVVEKVWLDSQCQINFQLKNAGQGNIPDGEHRESAVRVQFDSETKEFALGKVDPNGNLKKAGSLVSFDTEMKLSSSVDVMVIVDSNQKIKESDAGERNNEKITRLTPQGSTVVKLPQEMVRAEIKPLPFDLAIDKVYLNDLTCKIHVVLRNLGTEKISEEVYKIGRVRILSEPYKNVSPWTLSQVDTGRELNSRKLKDFDTGLILNRKERVTFRLENVKDKTFSDDQKIVELIPSSRCLQAKTVLPSVVQKKVLPRIEPMREAPSSETLDRTLQITRRSPPIEESMPSKTGISKSLLSSPSISVTSPLKGDILPLGSTFTIKWKVPEGADSWVAIDLFLPGTQLTPSNYQKTWSYLVEATSNDGAYDWENISFSTPYQGPLQIRIRTIDGKAYGESEVFSIGPPKEEK